MNPFISALEQLDDKKLLRVSKIPGDWKAGEAHSGTITFTVYSIDKEGAVLEVGSFEPEGGSSVALDKQKKQKPIAVRNTTEISPS